jgi:hypothetical protein
MPRFGRITAVRVAHPSPSVTLALPQGLREASRDMELKAEIRGTFCGAHTPSRSRVVISIGVRRRSTYGSATHKWQPTVCAAVHFRLVHVDEDARMAQGSSTPVTGDDTVMCPPNRLFVDELDSRVGLRLSLKSGPIPQSSRSGKD